MKESVKTTQRTNDKMNRKIWLDASKGIGILLVMIFHSSAAINIYLGRLLTAGSLGMFFVLSGITTDLNVGGISFRKKAKRLLIPYFIYDIFLICMVNFIQVVIGGGTLERLQWDITGIFYSRFALFPIEKDDNIYFMKCCNSPLWFLTAMFVAYVWVAVYEKMKSQKMRNILIVCYLGITVCFTKFPVLLPWSLDTSFLAALLIIAGMKIAKTSWEKLEKKWLVILLVISIVFYVPVALWNEGVNLSVRVYGSRGWMSVFAFGIICILMTIIYGGICLLAENTLIIKVLARLGQQTMVLLCSHVFIYYLVNIILGRFVENNFVLAVLEIGGALAMNLFVQMVCRLTGGLKGKETWKL